MVSQTDVYNKEVALNPHKIVQYLKKPQREFTKNDIIKYIVENNIQMLNLRHAGEDGKLKTLNFAINSLDQLDTILSSGERVDGSSLFSYIEAGSSDLYIIPRFGTAFVNPFSDVPTVDILCGYYDHNGCPLASSPEATLRRAHQAFKEATGLTFKCMGELEYYIRSPVDDETYNDTDQRGYHSSLPYCRWESLRVEAMRLATECGGKIKYSHSEVGTFKKDGYHYEQHEIEFLPVPAEEAVDALVITKWIVRNLCAARGLLVTWAPKISVGKAGSGLHIHMMLENADGVNCCVADGKLSALARKGIAGILDAAQALTAFGNTVPTSYLRLVPHQEAPTYVCWGDRNRSVLVRVPLGWLEGRDMVKNLNPLEPDNNRSFAGKQTFEFRVPDGSASLHFLVAGLIVAVQHGMSMPNGLTLAESLYAHTDIFKPEFKDKIGKLAQLPTSCSSSADALLAKRDIFEANHVFTPKTIDSVAKSLKAYEDTGLNERIMGHSDEILEYVKEYLHCQ